MPLLIDNQYPTHVITYIVFTTLLIALVGLVVLNHAVKRAPVGYEDEHGFHEGVDPRRAMAFESELHGARTGPTARAPKEGFRTRRFLIRTLKRTVGRGT